MTLASFALSLSPLHYLPSLLHHLLLRVGRRRSLVLLFFCCAPRMMLRCVSVCPTGSVCCVLCVSSLRSLSVSLWLSPSLSSRHVLCRSLVVCHSPSGAGDFFCWLVFFLHVHPFFWFCCSVAVGRCRSLGSDRVDQIALNSLQASNIRRGPLPRY